MNQLYYKLQLHQSQTNTRQARCLTCKCSIRMLNCNQYDREKDMQMQEEKTQITFKKDSLSVYELLGWRKSWYRAAAGLLASAAPTSNARALDLCCGTGDLAFCLRESDRFSVVLGHIFPVIFKFKGGKGIATSVGVFLVANWWVALIAWAVMFVGMLFIKYASIFTIGFVIALSIVEICVCNPANWINYLFICGILLLVIYAHRANIVRLFEGKENKTELLKMLKGLGKKKQEKIVIEDAEPKEENK